MDIVNWTEFFPEFKMLGVAVGIGNWLKAYLQLKIKGEAFGQSRCSMLQRGLEAKMLYFGVLN